jgi:hypothetical protein
MDRISYCLNWRYIRDKLFRQDQGRLMRFPVWVLLAGLTTGCCFAQDATQPEGSPPKRCYPSASPPIHAWNAVMKGMPYRGKRVLQCEETLPDGTVIKGKESGLEWRDSQGRFRSQALTPLFENSDIYLVQVSDPVDHIGWTWQVGKDSPHQTTETRYKFRHEYAEWQMDYEFGQAVDSPDFKRVLLDPIWIHGVYAKGEQYFQLCQPGEYGNKTDRPAMIMVNETWISVDLGEAVKIRVTDSNGRKDTEDLYVLDRLEPDPTLFKPPAGNEVLESKPVGDAVDERTTEESGQPAQQPDLKAPAGAALMTISPAGTTTVTPARTAPPKH